jgi:hypothetical protein
VLLADGEKELAWRPLDTKDFGYVDFTTTGEPGLKYALGYLFSQRERRETLVLTGHGSARVWLNGQEIGRLNDTGGSEFAPYQRLPATLRPGRNVVLIKHWPGKETGGVNLRFPEGIWIAESPISTQDWCQRRLNCSSAACSDRHKPVAFPGRPRSGQPAARTSRERLIVVSASALWRVTATARPTMERSISASPAV